jgi:hypothetical protein
MTRAMPQPWQPLDKAIRCQTISTEAPQLYWDKMLPADFASSLETRQKLSETIIQLEIKKNELDAVDAAKSRRCFEIESLIGPCDRREVICEIVAKVKQYRT